MQVARCLDMDAPLLPQRSSHVGECRRRDPGQGVSDWVHPEALAMPVICASLPFHARTDDVPADLRRRPAVVAHALDRHQHAT